MCGSTWYLIVSLADHHLVRERSQILVLKDCASCSFFLKFWHLTSKSGMVISCKASASLSWDMQVWVSCWSHDESKVHKHISTHNIYSSSCRHLAITLQNSQWRGPTTISHCIGASADGIHNGADLQIIIIYLKTIFVREIPLQKLECNIFLWVMAPNLLFTLTHVNCLMLWEII